MINMVRCFFLTMLLLLLFVGSSFAAVFLKIGDSGEQVALIQQKLAALGYNVSENSGSYDEKTKNAVMAFQRAAKLPVTGSVDDVTYSFLVEKKRVYSRASGVVNSLIGNNVVQIAMRYMGTPYVWGGEEPGGFDCSGLVQYVFALAGKAVPRTADIQYYSAVPIGDNELCPGDLVFFTTYEPGPSHVGIYIGEGCFIQAAVSQGVSIASLYDSYWRARYLGARRVL